MISKLKNNFRRRILYKTLIQQIFKNAEMLSSFFYFYKSVFNFAFQRKEHNMSVDIKKIQNLVTHHSDEIELVEKTGKSAIWHNMYSVSYQNNSVEYVCCKKVLPFSKKIGTGNIMKHIKSCVQSSSPSTATEKITSFIERKSPIPQQDKRKINEFAVRWIAKDIRPFSIIEGYGFKVSTYIGKKNNINFNKIY